MTEQWRAVPGWEGLYEVSDHGQVRSLGRQTATRRVPYPPRLLVPQRRSTGYLATCLHATGKQWRMVHRLVADAFIPKPDDWAPDWEVHHKNGVRDDNRADNLAWLSIATNRTHRRKATGPWHTIREERDHYRELATWLLILLARK